MESKREREREREKEREEERVDASQRNIVIAHQFLALLLVRRAAVAVEGRAATNAQLGARVAESSARFATTLVGALVIPATANTTSHNTNKLNMNQERDSGAPLARVAEEPRLLREDLSRLQKGAETLVDLGLGRPNAHVGQIHRLEKQKERAKTEERFTSKTASIKTCTHNALRNCHTQMRLGRCGTTCQASTNCEP